MGTETPPAVHVVAISGGKDSVAMALRLRELNPTQAYRYVITPTGNEPPDMAAHWTLLGAMLGAPLERLGTHTLESLMEAQDALPSSRMRWCTRMLKIVPVQAFYASLPAGSVAYVGLRADEEEREGLFGGQVRQAFPLREWGWGIDQVRGYLSERGVAIPKRTDCEWCPFQGADDWYQLWRDSPESYARAEAWEAKVSAARGRPTSFRSPTAKLGTWAARLEDMRVQFEAGKLTREEVKRQKRACNPLLVLEDSEQGEACRTCRL